jgi:hypothetical protein
LPLLIIDDVEMRKLPPPAAEERLEIVMRRHERGRIMVTSNSAVEDWSKLLRDSGSVTAMLDRLLPHGHILKCFPRSWRTKQACRIRKRWKKSTKSRATSVGRFCPDPLGLAEKSSDISARRVNCSP